MDHHTFTKQYLAIIRDTLRISENDDGQLTYHWDKDTADELTRRLENHLDIYTKSAIETAREHAEDELYSYHFGLSPNLNETLKYAPLYTDHVVLQDIVYRTLRGRQRTSEQQLEKSVMSYVNNIVKWEPLIEEGHLSILPSPHLWSEPIREYLDKIETGEKRILTQPLLATDRLNTKPFTDAPHYSGQLTQMAMGATQLMEAAKTGDIDLVNNGGWEQIDTMHEARVLSVGSQLLGTNDDDSQADLYYLPDASYEDVIELATEFDGFRSCYDDIVRDLVNSEGGEVEELIAQAPDKIESDYRDIKQRLQFKRKGLSAAAGIAGLAITLPVFVNISPEDLLTTSYLMSNSMNWEELLNAVISVASGVTGTLALSELAKDLTSEEHEFHIVMSELERASTNNSHVESLRPI
ncbi:hypothetical protein [Halorubrum distributum]|uniref:Uncharacterized protein n=1 Tax=Halorubrum distributum JCM 10247 TaxID=1227486 RepID=M0D3M3_9EURY|nr:hypothetical protein [Halorubrum terrestre]ELZ30121.1 hypothetical protein C473_13424 [Halorubrum terrestre JCM 10247]